MAKRLYLDMETRSVLNVTDVGAYKYASHPTTEAICFAYAFDDEPVQLWKRGEVLPEEVVAHLAQSFLVVAHNAAFDRAILNHEFCDPQDLLWTSDHTIDTAAKCRAAGIPAKLGDAAVFLNLPYQKMTTGKLLVAKLSRPQSTTPLIWNENPVALEQMYEYCKRDVETMRALDKALPDLSPEEHKVWMLDQKINGRGVKIDKEFCEKGQRLVGEYKESLDVQMREITGGKVRSCTEVKRITDWAINAGAVSLKSIGKKEIADALDGELPPVVRGALSLRKNFAKTSAAKLKTFLACMDGDGRARDQYVFHGAGTGRWCLTGQHEVLTPEGWVEIKNWIGGKIAVWSPTEQISFQESKQVSFPYEGELVHYESQRIDQISTPDHSMPYWDIKTGQFGVRLASNYKRAQIPYTGVRQTDTGDALESRILVMTQADGSYVDGNLNFHFRKQRKIERCKSLLRRGQIPYTVYTMGDGTVKITLPRRVLPTYLQMFENKTFGWWLLNTPPDAFFDELEFWDGYRCGPNSIQYTTCNRQNADVIQAFAHLSGRAVSIVMKHENHERWSPAYVLNIWLRPSNRHELRNTPKVWKSDGTTVYCAETTTGFFLVRRNGKVWVTGNSGKLGQLQNLPKFPKGINIGNVLEAVKSGRAEEILKIGLTPSEAVSGCLRAAIMAAEGKTLYGADYSAIEARVLAWLAGQSDIVDRFRAGEDVYLYTASRIFGRKITEADEEERTIGKVAVLALGYQGGVKAFDNMARNYGVTVDESKRAEIVRAFRDANSKIVQYWRDVERAALDAMDNPGVVFPAGPTGRAVRFLKRGQYLLLRLPNGRKLSYPKPGVVIQEKFGRRTRQVVYTGKLAGKTGTFQLEQYGGKWCENITQAVARDCMVEGMLNLERAGFTVIAHTHDEVICENEGKELAELERQMTLTPAWAEGLPLAVKGWTASRYTKG